MERQSSERAIVALVAAVQLVNWLDFVMVMPLGPDFARGLGIDLSALGSIGGSYTLAACISGVVCSLFLDRFDRRPALAVAMLGLVLGTAAGGFATGLGSLLAARVLAGIFGGPATSLSYSIVADVIPVERRGRAMGVVMSSFGVAQALGIPLGLELAERGSWRTPFFFVAGLGAVTVAGAIALLPPLRLHLSSDRPPAALDGLRLLGRPSALLSFVAMASLTFAAFLVIPNYSGFVQQNLGYPRAHLSRLYLVAGGANFALLTTVGRVVDRSGALVVVLAGSVLLCLSLSLGMVVQPAAIGPMAILAAFALGNSLRQVALSTLTSRVPEPAERAGFMSIQNAALHLASSGGMFLSSYLLRETAAKTLEGMDRVALLCMGLAPLVPVLVVAIERSIRLRGPRPAAAGAAATPAPAAEMH